MPAIASGADVLANNLLVSLTAGVDFVVPDIDLEDPSFEIPPATGDMYLPVSKLTAADLTTGQVGGTGMFDQLMVSLVNHLKIEYTANRIAGAEYTKAYIGVIGAALQTASQFLLAKDQSYWQAILVQQQARVAEIEVVKARVELETAKAMLVRTQYEAHNAEAQYGLTKMQIANADATYATSVAQATGINYTNTNILPAQKFALDFTNEELLPAQKNLVLEQAEVQHSQTHDSRLSGPIVAGAVGKQKALYDQQIKSYDFDSKTKVVKMYADSFITQLTVNEGIPVPEQFDKDSINTILLELRDKVGFDSV